MYQKELESLTAAVREARRIIDIFNGKDARNNARILHGLAVLGPSTGYSLAQKLDIEQSVVNRRLNKLESKGV